MILKTLRACGLAAVCALAISAAGCGGGGGGGAAPADVTGRVVGVASGSPIPNATVSIGGGSATTDANGQFTLRSISSSATQINVSGTGLQALTETIGTLKPTPAINDLGDVFVLSTADAGGYTANVTAQVVRADTLAPLPGASVTMSGHGTTTDASGNFTLSGLPVGLGTAGTPVGIIKASGFEDKSILLDFPLVTGNNPLGQIQVAPPVNGIPGGPYTIKGKVSLQGLTDLSGTVVTLKDKASGTVLGSGTTLNDGLYGFWVVPGTYTVIAEHAGPPAFSPKSVDVTLLRTDQPVTANITLTP